MTSSTPQIKVSAASYRLWVNATLEFDKVDTSDPRHPVPTPNSLISTTRNLNSEP